MIYKIGELCDVYDGPHATPKETESGPVYLGIKAITEQGRIDSSQFKYLSNEDYIKWTKRVTPQSNDIVFSYEATLGRYAIIPDGFHGCLGRRLAIVRVRDNKKLNYKYLYYYFLSPIWKAFISNNAVSGSTVDRISIDEFPNYEIEVPEIKIQNMIVSILDAVDTKIDINIKTINTLESMAKTLYDYWFVQFDFPDANGKPYKTSGGKMEWNETLSREIPAGWEVEKLSSLCELKNGINYDKSVKGDKLYRIVNVRNITATSLLVDEQGLDEIKLLSKQAEKYLVGDNDILIARSGNPGAVRLLTNNHNVIYCGFIICCQVLSEMLKLYLTFTLKKYEGTNLTKTGGSIMQNVSQDTLNSIGVIVPPQDIIQVYNEKVISMVEKIKILVEETNKLANLRDFLLPMLMNGQVTFRQ